MWTLPEEGAAPRRNPHELSREQTDRAQRDPSVSGRLETARRFVGA